MNIKKILNKANFIKLGSGSMLSMVATAAAYADGPTTQANSLEDVANNIGTLVTYGVTAIKGVAAVAGLVLLCIGLMRFKQGSQDMQGTQGHHKIAMICLLVGACLLASPILIGIMQQTLIGAKQCLPGATTC